MTIIRMIKLFAWENRVSDRIDSRREEELVYLRAFNVLRMVNDNVKCVPLLLSLDEHSHIVLAAISSPLLRWWPLS